MIENYIKVLTSKNYQQQMKISIDNATETLKDVLREIESFRESPRTYALSSYLPSYQCAKKAEYTIGKAGIGPFALNNAHHVLTQLVQMRMATDAFTRTYDIDRLDKQYDNDGSGTRILDWLSALINAFVDIAKDPFVIRLNVNAYTYNITAYLIRMGYGRDTFYLLNQPIIVELAKNILNVRGNFGKPKDMTQYELEQSIIYETLRKYGVDYDHIKNRIKDFIYDNGEPNLEYEAQLASEKRRQFEGFRKVIRKEANETEMRNAVQDAALLFFLFNKYASSVANLVKYSKIDTKKHGKSIAEWNAYLQGMEDLTTDEFFGEGEVERFYRSTFIWKKTYNTITWALSFNQVMLRASESFQNRLQNLLKVLGKKSKINPDVLNKIVNSMEAGIKAGFINEAFYATGRYDDLYDVFYGDYSVPRRLLKLKSDIKQGKYPDLLNDDGSIANEFLNYLFPNVYKNVTVYEQPDFVDTRMSTTLDINMQNEIIYSWDELLHYPNDEVRELAEDLIYYAFYTSGDQTNPNSFFRFVPFSWREGYVEEGENQFNAKGYASYIQNLLTNDGDINYSMLYDSDVFLNNWQDEVLVPTIPESVRTQVIVNGQLEYQTVGRIGVAATSVIEGTDLHPMILFMGDTNPKSEMYIKPVAYEIVGIRRIPIFSPYVKMQYTPKYNPNGIMVYKLIGVNIRKTESGTYYTPIYSLVNKKGYNYKGHWIVEYGTSANFNFNTFLDATFQPISEDDLRSQRLMEYISRSIPNEKLQQYLLSFFSRAVPISQYYGMLDMQDFSSSKLFESYTQDDSADDSSSFVQSTKAPISAEDELDKRKPVTSNADGYVLHSGGAPGGDTWWSKIAEEFGIPNTPERQHHYYAGERSDSNAPLGNVMTSVEDVIEGSSKAAQAAKANWGYQYDYMKDPRLVRDWSQVKYSDAVFAIGHLVKPGERIFPNQKNDTRTAKQFAVAGGTGYAVEMAIQAGKPVYVYDQERKQWYKNIDGKWSKSDVPVLTKNFAGIGTRQINQDGINAIRQVFQKTFNIPSQTQNSNQSQQQQSNTDDPFDGVKSEWTYQDVLDLLGGGIDDVATGHAQSEVKDAVTKFNQGVTMEEVLQGVSPVFTQEEIEQIERALNGSPLRVKSVSRFTDPAFYAREIIKFLEENAKKPFTDPSRVNVIELWTKHDGQPIQDILKACKKYKVAPMVSFSITGLGDTALEKGVLKYNDLLDMIQKLIDSGDLNVATTTIRIDPLLVGYTNMDDVRNIVKRCKSMGFKKFVTSLVQSYGYTEGTDRDRKVVSGINNALASQGQSYDWDKYYGRITREDVIESNNFTRPYTEEHPNADWAAVVSAGFKQRVRVVSQGSIGKVHFTPKWEYVDEIGEQLLKIQEENPDIIIETCSFTINGLRASACLDPLIIERLVGVDVTRPDGTYDRDTSRPDCMCYGAHSDMFRMNEKKCFSSCAYCYAKQSGTNNAVYYNSDGQLIDRPLTRVNGEFIGASNGPTQTNDDVDETIAIQEQIQALQQALEEMGYDDNEVSDLMNRFHQENDADIHTADDAANLIRKFICNL